MPHSARLVSCLLLLQGIDALVPGLSGITAFATQVWILAWYAPFAWFWPAGAVTDTSPPPSFPSPPPSFPSPHPPSPHFPQASPPSPTYDAYQQTYDAYLQRIGWSVPDPTSNVTFHVTPSAQNLFSVRSGGMALLPSMRTFHAELRDSLGAFEYHFFLAAPDYADVGPILLDFNALHRFDDVAQEEIADKWTGIVSWGVDYGFVHASNGMPLSEDASDVASYVRFQQHGWAHEYFHTIQTRLQGAFGYHCTSDAWPWMWEGGATVVPDVYLSGTGHTYTIPDVTSLDPLDGDIHSYATWEASPWLEYHSHIVAYLVHTFGARQTLIDFWKGFTGRACDTSTTVYEDVFRDTFGHNVTEVLGDAVDYYRTNREVTIAFAVSTTLKADATTPASIPPISK
jgi:hypothetical protein